MKGKRIVILGAGESGTGAALLARALGAEVWVSDSGPIAARFQRELQDAGIAFEEKNHDTARVAAADLIVKSPGIPPKAPIVAQAVKQGKEVIGEIEFAYRHAGPCRILAITGSNGKTTTTTLCQHLLAFNKRPARMGGNVGHSFARLIADDIQSGRAGDRERIFVLEVSSFQLDDCHNFRPNIGILLNITPDHLDRYEYEMARYVAAKFRLTARMGRGDLFITHADDAYINAYMAQNPEAVRCKTERVAFADLRNAC
ncbi:MAG: Mur ligase family protein, partial [Saprospiraceae bacterium]